MTILQNPTANIGSTSTMQLLQDENGTLYAGLLAYGWNKVDAGGARLVTAINGSFDGDAPTADGPLIANTQVADTSSTVTSSGSSASEWKFYNDRNYNVGILGFNYGDIGQANVPPGEIWEVTLQALVDNNPDGWQPIALQVYDNSYDTATRHAFSKGPMLVPYGRILTPGTALDIQLQITLGRTGNGGGTFSGVVTTSAHFICWPAL